MKLSLISVVSLAIFQSLQFDTAEAKKYELIKLKEDKHLCWGVGKVKEGEVLRLVDCDDDDDDQLWEWDDDDIIPKEDDHLCVHARAEKGNHLRLRKCMKTNKQKWKYDENHDDDITPKTDDKLCVSFRGGGDPDEDNKLVLKKCNGKDTQGWKK